MKGQDGGVVIALIVVISQQHTNTSSPVKPLELSVGQLVSAQLLTPTRFLSLTGSY